MTIAAPHTPQVSTARVVVSGVAGQRLGARKVRSGWVSRRDERDLAVDPFA